MDHRPTQSPLLDHCPDTMPREAYIAPDWYVREMATIWARHWVCIGRLADLGPGTMRPEMIGTAPVLVARAEDGTISAFHNACRHRGASCARRNRPWAA